MTDRDSETRAKAGRDELDWLVLDMLGRVGGDDMTYVLRNRLDQPGRPLYRSGLTTAQVLQACRRLERLGFVRTTRTVYAVQKCWVITDAGRARLATLTQGDPS